jgi:hypothetical protein
MKDHMDNIQQRKKFFTKAMEDIDKQREKLTEEYIKQNNEDWIILSDFLNSKNFIPAEYNKTKHTLSFVLREDAVYMEDTGDDEDFSMKALPVPKELVRALMKKLFGEKKDE